MNNDSDKAVGQSAAPAPLTANPANLVGEKIFIRSYAKIGRVTADDGGDTVKVRLSPDAEDATAPIVTVSRNDIVRNVHGG